MVWKLKIFGNHFTPGLVEHALLAAEEPNKSLKGSRDSNRWRWEQKDNSSRNITEAWWSEKIHWSQRKRPWSLMWGKWSWKIKNKVILKVFLDLKIYFNHTVYLYRMKNILHLNLRCLFLPKKSKTLYSGNLVIAVTLFRNHRCPL